MNNYLPATNISCIHFWPKKMAVSTVCLLYFTPSLSPSLSQYHFYNFCIIIADGMAMSVKFYLGLKEKILVLHWEKMPVWWNSYESGDTVSSHGARLHHLCFCEPLPSSGHAVSLCHPMRGGRWGVGPQRANPAGKSELSLSLCDSISCLCTHEWTPRHFEFRAKERDTAARGFSWDQTGWSDLPVPLNMHQHTYGALRNWKRHKEKRL